MGGPRGSRVAAIAGVVALALVAVVAVAPSSGAQEVVGAEPAAEPVASSSIASSAAGSSVVGSVAPGPALGDLIDPLRASISLSTSIGGPANGRVRGAIALPPTGPGLRSNALRPNPDAYYGTVELIRSLVRAAAAVHGEIPGSELVVNDIGFREGGPIPHHGSHQAGRDVDVLFYYLDREGQPFPSKGIPVDPRGRGWDFADLSDPRDDVRVRLDVPRSWRFVQALVEDDLAGEGGLVQRIFLAEHIRALLLEHAERVRAPRAVRERFADLTCQPGHPHDDHFHVRFFCSAEDLREGCADGAPMYPWRLAQLRDAGVDPVRATREPRRRERVRERTTSRAAAARGAGPMHARVRAFLAEREAWSVQPHPGRPYCR